MQAPVNTSTIQTLARLTSEPKRAEAFQTLCSGDPEGEGIVQQVFATSPITEQKRFEVYTAADALKVREPIRWVIEDLFSEGSVSIVVGAPGSKKTYSMLDAGICVALGANWLGYKTMQGSVLIVDEESGSRRISNRLAACIRGHGAGESIPIHFTTLAQLNMRDEYDCACLEDLIKERSAKLVLIDALADVMPDADENAVKDVQPVFMALRGISDRTHCAIVIIHHSNKSGGYRGSTSISGAVDVMLKVASKSDSPNIDFSFEKARDVEPFKFSAVAHFEPEKFWLTSSSAVARAKPLSRAEDDVMRYLRDNGASDTKTIIAAAVGNKPQTVRQAIQSLKRVQLIRRVDGNGKGTMATYEVVS